MVPGIYGNININGALTLAPGIYNINSLSMQGNGSITVTPPGAVTLNIGGTGQSNPLAIAGNGITDDTIPNDFIINYAGTGTISVAGNGNVTAIMNAPNAPMTQQGNGASVRLDPCRHGHNRRERLLPLRQERGAFSRQ